MSPLPLRPPRRRGAVIRAAALALAAAAAPLAAQAEPECGPPLRLPDGRENLGPCVNTPLDEAVPQVTADGRTLYFTRRFVPENTGGVEDPDDVWVSVLGADGAWGRPGHPGSPLNGPGPGWVLAAPVQDGALLIANAPGPDPRGRRGVSLARPAGDGWATPEPLPVPDLATASEWGQLHMSADGAVLVASLEREGSLGGHDLFVSLRTPDGAWAPFRSLGPTLNTPAEEMTPYLAADGETLYFSSDGRGGEGGQDVFLTRRLDESWTRWSEPRNLGRPVNTPGDDAGYVVPAAGDYAYFHSSQGSLGGLDLFRVALPADARPRPVTVLRGRVIDRATGRPLDARVDLQTVLGGAASGRALAEDGSFQVVLQGRGVWCVAAEAPGGRVVVAPVDLSAREAFDVRPLELQMAPADSAGVGGACAVRLTAVHFAVDSDRIRESAFAQLDSVAEVLKGLPNFRAEVAGHTDSDAGDAYNLDLSARRAAAVADYLVARGVPRDRIPSRGYGEREPAQSNATAAGRAANRRVELRLLQL